MIATWCGYQGWSNKANIQLSWRLGGTWCHALGPIKFFFSNLTSSCPNCLECSGMTQSLRATRWKDSRTKCDELCLYGLTNRVLPVSGVYVCDLRHQIAHDPSILSQVLGCFAHSICLISQGWSDERTV